MPLEPGGRGAELRIGDILEAIARVEQYVEGMTFERFAADKKTVDAVIRNLTVIGEASAHVPAEWCGRAPEIPWQEMRGMRNIVVHEPFGVSLEILWETVRNDLPPLAEPLRVLLAGR